MDITFTNVTTEVAHDLIDYYEVLTSPEDAGNPEETMAPEQDAPEALPLQPAAPEAVAQAADVIIDQVQGPVAEDKPKQKRRGRSDAGKKREPYGPRIAPNNAGQMDAPSPEPVAHAAPAPKAKPEVASAPAAVLQPAVEAVQPQQTVRPSSTDGPQTVASGEASLFIDSKKKWDEQARDALTRVYNKLGRGFSLATLQRKGLTKVSDLKEQNAADFVNYCAEVYSGLTNPMESDNG